MSRNAAIRIDEFKPYKFSEQELIEGFAETNCELSAETQASRLKALKIAITPHQIKKARETNKDLNKNMINLSQLINRMERIKKSPKCSSELRTYLLQEIESRKADQAIIENAQKDMSKSEKCGSIELGNVTKEKDLWTNVLFGLVVAGLSTASTLVVATSGQSLCLSVLAGTTGLASFAAAKVSIAGRECEILQQSIDDGTYWCNSGPQRPGSKEVIRMICANTKQRIQRRFTPV